MDASSTVGKLLDHMFYIFCEFTASGKIKMQMGFCQLVFAGLFHHMIHMFHRIGEFVKSHLKKKNLVLMNRIIFAVFPVKTRKINLVAIVFVNQF